MKFDIKSLTTAATRTLHKVGFIAKKYSPEILVVSGVIGGVTSAVMACNATTKAGDILDEHHDKMEAINKVVEMDDDSYTVEDRKKDTVIVYTQTAMEFAKLYAPSVILGATSIAAILSSYNIIRKRNVALSAAYAAVDKGFKEYRNRVVERFGKEIDHELKYNLKAKEFETIVTAEDGTEVVSKEVVQVAENPNDISDFAVFFDESCWAFSRDPEANKIFLKQQQNYANDKLKAQGYLFLNEVYQMIGAPKTKAGQVVGWVYDEKNPIGDNYVDFGIYDMNRERVRAFVNGYEAVILLDFNVDGNILDLM